MAVQDSMCAIETTQGLVRRMRKRVSTKTPHSSEMSRVVRDAIDRRQSPSCRVTRSVEKSVQMKVYARIPLCPNCRRLFRHHGSVLRFGRQQFLFLRLRYRNDHIVVHPLQKHLTLEANHASFLRRFESADQRLVILLNLVIVKKLTELYRRRSRLIANATNVRQKLQDLFVNPLLRDWVSAGSGSVTRRRVSEPPKSDAAKDLLHGR